MRTAILVTLLVASTFLIMAASGASIVDAAITCGAFALFLGFMWFCWTLLSDDM